MKVVVRHILLAVACLFFLVSCGGGKEKVIPRAKMAEIYAEMFVTDQWIVSNPSLRRKADTSLVYAPILEKYGYTSADYRRSVDKYMDDPERFARILRSTAGILEKRIEVLNKDKEELMRLKALEILLEQLKYESDFRPEEFFPYLFDEPYVHYYDSLEVRPDSVLQVYRLKNIDRADTLFDGVRIIVKDTLVFRDSAEIKEEVADTVANVIEK